MRISDWSSDVCSSDLNLNRDGILASTHRGHGHTLAKGADAGAMMRELLGREGGTSHGKGGSMHIADFEVGMLGANGVVRTAERRVGKEWVITCRSRWSADETQTKQ